MSPLQKLRLEGPRILILLLAGWVAWNLFQSVRYVLADYTGIPVYDYWRIPQLWADPQTIHWSNLWVQHNEHRIIFPELVDITDMLWLHGQMYLPIAISGVCYLGIWLVMAWAAYSQDVLLFPTRELSLLMAGVMLLWKGCSTVIATPFQLQFTLLQLAAALSFLFLAMLADTGRRKYLTFVIAAAVAATYSSANGMLLWLLLIAYACYLRIGWQKLAGLSVAAILSIGAFFFHYDFLPSSMAANSKHPVQELAFLCSYLSMPFGWSSKPSIGIQLGALNLIGMAICGIFARRKRLLKTRFSVVVFGTYVFILASALLTAAGRMEVSDHQFNQAKAWRYVTMPTVTWALLAAAIVWLAGTRSAVWAMAAVLEVSACFGHGFDTSVYWLESARVDAANGQITATMLRNGLFDANQVRTIFPSPKNVAGYLPALERGYKSIYAHGPDQWLNGDIRTLTLNPNPISGNLTQVVPVPGGVEIVGWAEGINLTADHPVLIVNGHDRIVGFGRRPAAGLPFPFGTSETPHQLAFIGYAKAKAGDRLSVYAATHHGRELRPIGKSFPVPSIEEVAAQTDNQPLPGVTWIPESSWTKNGYPASQEEGGAPASSVYGSWSGSDLNTGMIHTNVFPTPGDQCLILPVMHGVDTYGQSVEVMDADRQQVIANIPFLDGHSSWLRYRLPIPSETHRVLIQAADTGGGTNEWLAVASPEQCSAGR